jgi:hypothetical protein
MAASASSFFVKNREQIDDVKQIPEQIIMGIGGSISAINGDKIVDILANRLQIPKTLEQTIDGKYSALTI